MSALVPVVFDGGPWEQQPVTVLTWLVDEGETLAAGDDLVEVGIPGLMLRIASPTAGRLIRHQIPVGRPVVAADVLAWVTPLDDL